MLERAEQSGETRVAVEARQAQPVDGAVASNEGGRPAIADQGIVLDGERRLGSSERLHRLIRRRADARVYPLHGRSIDASCDRRWIRGELWIELAQDVRNDILDRAADVDMDRIFVGVWLLQNVQLAVEKAGRPQWPFPLGEAGREERPIPAQIDHAHLRSSVGQEIAIAAPQRRAGDHAGRAELPPLIDQSRDLLEPGPSVALIGRMAGLQLGEGRRRMKVVAFLERPVQPFGEDGRDRRLAAACKAHQNDDRPNTGALGGLHRDLTWGGARRARRGRRAVGWLWTFGRAPFDHRRSLLTPSSSSGTLLDRTSSSRQCAQARCPPPDTRPKLADRARSGLVSEIQW